MLNEELSFGSTGRPDLSRLRTRLNDTLIRARESALDRLAGGRASLVINGGLPGVDMAAPDDLAARLRQTLVELKAAAMDKSGAKVDYRALRHSRAYARYRDECLAALRQFKPETLTTLPARQAFWINLYNALVLDAVIAFGVKHSVIEGRLGMLSFFRRAAYLVDGRRVSLEDIEHGILRANRGNPYFPGAHFPSGDPRLAWSLPLDPRLHFALNCGGQSCPPIRSYSAEELDDQLDLATRGFLAATVEIRREKEQLLLSRIFQWYRGDFGGREEVLDFLIRYLPDDERCRFLSEARARLRFRYITYDWGLNSV